MESEPSSFRQLARSKAAGSATDRWLMLFCISRIGSTRVPLARAGSEVSTGFSRTAAANNKSVILREGSSHLPGVWWRLKRGGVDVMPCNNPRNAHRI